MEVIVMPFHSQGHMNTMLQFAKRLAYKGNDSIQITLATALSTTQKMSNSNNDFNFIRLETIYDDSNETGLNFQARMNKFKIEASVQLDRLITATLSRSSGTKCLLIYDANMEWALDVAKKCNVLTAAFVTQGCAYVASFYPLFLQEYPHVAAADVFVDPPLSVPILSEEELLKGLPGLQYLSSTSSNSDYSGADFGKKPIHLLIRMVLVSMENLHLADWVLFNSFDQLEDEIALPCSAQSHDRLIVIGKGNSVRSADEPIGPLVESCIFCSVTTGGVWLIFHRGQGKTQTIEHAVGLLQEIVRCVGSVNPTSPIPPGDGQQLKYLRKETKETGNWDRNAEYRREAWVVKWMKNLWHVRTIGPTLPSEYLDKRIEYDVNYGFSLYKPNDEACRNWLNAKQAASVVYVAFGSAASLSVDQMTEMAEALKQNPSSFLWVVREGEQKKLPKDFISETSDKGLVISWCAQLDVLSHEAVGCFVTHCGWNSTIEALSFGVPMLAMPQFMDQLIDAHFVDQVWGVGIRPKKNEDNIVTCEEIKHSLEEIMHGQRAEKIKENAAKWKALAREAVSEGGSTDKHIDEIINRLASL
uniref:Glycosyltransferase n=1 Tax=Chenopodium quinoa TaxID=63459 RepID=A0A803NB89_CHEQI